MLDKLFNWKELKDENSKFTNLQEQFGSYYVKHNNEIIFDKEFDNTFDYSILEGVDSIYFGKNFNTELKKIPNHIKRIQFGLFFNQPIDDMFDVENSEIEVLIFGHKEYYCCHFNKLVKKWPKNIREIYFGNCFTCKLINLPNKLEKLYFQIGVNHLIDFPDSVKTLVFRDYVIEDMVFPRNMEKLSILRSVNPSNYPENVKELELKVHSNHVINLPRNLEILTLSGSYTGEIILPDGLKKFNFFCDRSRMVNETILSNGLKSDPSVEKHNKIKEIVLPDSIEIIHISLNFAKYKIMNFPRNLKKLHCSYSLNQEIIPELPNGLIELILYQSNLGTNLPDSIEILKGISYPLEHYPNNLKEIEFTDNFNEEVNNLPFGLEKIIFGKHFSRSVQKLPSTVREIQFGDDFNLTINKLPYGLKKLEFEDKFNKPIDKLPDTIEELRLGYKFNQVVNKWPASLKRLECDTHSKFNYPLVNLPDGLKEIYLSFWYNVKIEVFPRELEIIDMGDSYSFPLDNFGPNLKKLILPRRFNFPLENLPIGLKYLRLGNDFNQSLDFLPDTLEVLILSNRFEGSLGNLPSSLKALSIRDALVVSDIDSLPDSIEILHISSICDDGEYDIDIKKLPRNLKILMIDEEDKTEYPVGDYRKIYGLNFNDLNLF